MASKLLTSLIAGSLILSSSVAAAQVGAPVQPAPETSLGSNGESRLGEGGDIDATTAILFGLIVFVIAVFVGRGGNDPEPPVGNPTSP